MAESRIERVLDLGGRMYGWMCPRCGLCHSPLVDTCSCSPPSATVSSTGGIHYAYCEFHRTIYVYDKGCQFCSSVVRDQES